MSFVRCTFQLEVRKIKLPEENKKERKIVAQRKIAQNKIILIIKKDIRLPYGQMVALESRVHVRFCQ